MCWSLLGQRDRKDGGSGRREHGKRGRAMVVCVRGWGAGSREGVGREGGLLASQQTASVPLGQAKTSLA